MKNLVNKLKNLLVKEINFNEIDARKSLYKENRLNRWDFLFKEGGDTSYKRKIIYLQNKVTDLFLLSDAKYSHYAKEVFKDYEDYKNVWIANHIWLNIPFEKTLLNAILEEIEK